MGVVQVGLPVPTLSPWAWYSPTCGALALPLAGALALPWWICETLLCFLCICVSACVCVCAFLCVSVCVLVKQMSNCCPCPLMGWDFRCQHHHPGHGTALPAGLPPGGFASTGSYHLISAQCFTGLA